MIVATTAPVSIIIWSLVLMAVVIGGYVAVMWVRRSLRQGEQATPVGFSLDDLRRMHREGQLTDEEFERARAKMVAGLRAKEQSK